MSARNPLPSLRESTGVSTISPTASMPAVVSVRVTIITTTIEMIGAMWNSGTPSVNNAGGATIGPSPTVLKSAIPSGTAMTVPSTMPNRIDILETPPWLIRDSTIMINSVSAASPIAAMPPPASPAALPSPLSAAQSNALGSSVNPITVITEPVTTGGKNRTILPKTMLNAIPIRPAPIVAPKTAPRPWDWAIAPMVDTAENEAPCTSGSRDPNIGSPSVCSSVATPLTKMVAVMSTLSSAADNPAASPTINGGAMRPPYIVRMCWVP